MKKATNNEHPAQALRRYPLPTAATRAKAVILADGEYPGTGTIAGAILRSAEYVICCDGAADSYIADVRVPAAIVGDCDSLGEATLRLHADIIHRSSDTNTNDLTKSVLFCLSQGIGDIIILGATGRREDHTLGNIGLLSRYAAMEGVSRISMITDNGVFDAITEDSMFDSFKGQQVSLFTIDPATPVGSDGLFYTLPPNLNAWWCGTLNESLGDSFMIRTTSRTIVFRVF